MAYQVSTDRFNWHKDLKTFTAEASDFNGTGIFEQMFGRLFQDACDVGFELVSQRTGKKISMYLSRRATDEGDVTFWEFKPYRHSSFEKLVVFND